VHTDDVLAHRHDRIDTAEMVQLDDNIVPAAVPARQQRDGKRGRAFEGCRMRSGAMVSKHAIEFEGCERWGGVKRAMLRWV